MINALNAAADHQTRWVTIQVNVMINALNAAADSHIFTYISLTFSRYHICVHVPYTKDTTSPGVQKHSMKPTCYMNSHRLQAICKLKKTLINKWHNKLDHFRECIFHHNIQHQPKSSWFWIKQTSIWTWTCIEVLLKTFLLRRI